MIIGAGVVAYDTPGELEATAGAGAFTGDAVDALALCEELCEALCVAEPDGFVEDAPAEPLPGAGVEDFCAGGAVELEFGVLPRLKEAGFALSADPSPLVSVSSFFFLNRSRNPILAATLRCEGHYYITKVAVSLTQRLKFN